MCGRYTITRDLAGLEKIIRFIISHGTRPEGPRYNLAPRQQAPIHVWETRLLETVQKAALPEPTDEGNLISHGLVYPTNAGDKFPKVVTPVALL